MVVRRLREFYRPRDKTESFHEVLIDDLIEGVIELSTPKWKAQANMTGAAILIKMDLRPTRSIHGNAHELREALLNLIFNAVEAMPDGGEITLRSYAGHFPVDEAEAAVAEPTSPLPAIVIEVSDTGAGMPEEVRHKCLDPFFSTKGDHGTGLGLSMVYGIVKRHSGEIRIASELGKGTTFSIYLPLPMEGWATAALAPKPHVLERKLHVLLVDDDPKVREVLVEYLLSDGHTAETAVNGKDGLQQFLTGRFDLIITDQGMPMMSGDQLITAVRSITPDKPIIMLTGFGELLKLTHAEPPGASRVMRKPFTLGEIRNALSEIFDQPQ